MDWEAFERDVWDSINDNLWTRQWGNLDDSDPTVNHTGVVTTIGETWLGALYGTTENANGTDRVYLFDTAEEQRDWFDRQSEPDDVVGFGESTDAIYDDVPW